ncbi:MAG TPA: hypothetical protein VF198_04675 [Vicinamibacterales bacterium]
MLRPSLSCLALLLCAAVTTLASDVAGKWQGSVPTPDGDLTLTFEFKTEGEVLTGTVESVMGVAPLKNGKVNGNLLTFDVKVDAMVISHEATVDGDEITITARGDWGETVYVVRRVKP